MAQAHTRGGFGYLIPASLALLSAVFIAVPGTAQKPESAALTAPPPVAPVRMVTDEYFGVKVPDPYRYMENLKDPAVADWFKTQNDYTRSVLARIPGRAALVKRIEALDESVPARVLDLRRLPGGLYFYQKRLAQEEIAKLYVRNGLNGKERLLIDPAKFQRTGGPHYAIDYYNPSLDGRYVTIGISPAGSEDAVMRVIAVQTGKETGDIIERAQIGGASWLPDNRSFVYNRLQKLAPDAAPTDKYLNSRVYFHKLGTNPDQDPVVFGTGLAGVKIGASDLPLVGVIPGSSHAIGVIAHGVQNETTLYAAPLESVGTGSIPWSKICDVEDQVTAFDVRGDDLYLLSHLQASRFKVLHTRLSAPNVSRAELVVPPGQAVIRNIAAAEDALYVQTMDGGIGRVLRVPYGSNKPEQMSLPFDGAVSLSATDQRVSGTLVEIESWTKGKTIYAYDATTKRTADTGLQPKGAFDELPDIESIEVKAPSYDGTLIPLSIMRKKGVNLNGSNPTLLDGYGAYGISHDPYSDPRRLAWFEQGGVIAVAHIRGELGPVHRHLMRFQQRDCVPQSRR